jgi:hypothetical protein
MHRSCLRPILKNFMRFEFTVPKLPKIDTHIVKMTHINFWPLEFSDPEGAWSKKFLLWWKKKYLAIYWKLPTIPQSSSIASLWAHSKNFSLQIQVLRLQNFQVLKALKISCFRNFTRKLKKLWNFSGHGAKNQFFILFYESFMNH